jgi:SAM-dependent methyltransferase
MDKQPRTDPIDFDEYASEYDEALDEALNVSGEDKDYFARGRVQWLAGLLQRRGFRARTILDFGCGTGSAVPHLQKILASERVLGVDVSARSIEVARQQHGGSNTEFALVRDRVPDGSADLAFCNGVFHHIPVAERVAAVAYVRDSLRPGGLFALWENNPWNPGTNYVMSRCRFDRDAVTIAPPGARRMLRDGGFEIIRTDFLFVFPRLLRGLRWIEPGVSRLPFGAQYEVLARRR